MREKPLILITNDDGIHSPGIRALYEALKNTCDVAVIAPNEQQSGKGLGITLHEHIHIDPFPDFGDVPAWMVKGTPADCVKVGLGLLLKETPTMIVSGINNTTNSGRNVLYSGTIGGTIEGALRGIPGIAFSSVDDSKLNYEEVKIYVSLIVGYFMQHTIPFGTIINVNFPPTEKHAIKGFKMARQGQSWFLDDPDHRVFEGGKMSCAIGSRWDTHEEKPNSDVTLLEQGYITAAPIFVNDLTHHDLLDHHEQRFEDFYHSNVT